MNNEEINKYLTEAMGECWHEGDSYYSANGTVHCLHCQRVVQRKFQSCSIVNSNFFSNEGYGKLRDWYDGWSEERKDKFNIYVLRNRPEGVLGQWDTAIYAFHRDRLARLIYEFLVDK